MEDTNMTREWVERAWAKNPCAKLQNGDVRTGPVRLSFPHLLKPSKPTKDKPEGGFGAVLLFPLGVDLSVLRKEAAEVASVNWPEAGKPGGPKLFNPIRDQDLDGEKDPGVADRYAGYVKSAMRIGANANQRVQVVDRNLAPVVDEADIYPGVWAIVTMRCYAFGKQADAKKRGPTFGLQNVMLVADDTNIGGTAAANPREAFAGVNVEPGDIDADKAFGEGEKKESAEVDIFG